MSLDFYFVSKIVGTGLSFIEVLLKLLAIVVPLLISVAYFTLAERKLMGGMHRRRGPNVVGFVGFFLYTNLLKYIWVVFFLGIRYNFCHLFFYDVI